MTVSQKTRFDRDELLADHAYKEPLERVGYRLHGGFDEAGGYISPRTLARWPAVHAWQQQLKEKGLPLIDASTDLLKSGNYPNFAQERYLLMNGYGQHLWDSLTVTGVIEARGQALCQIDAPDFQNIIVEDISDTCAGHLHKGLLYAHGADEGGDPDQPEVGAHDAMWFAARDLCFGKDAFPSPEIPDSISRPQEVPAFPDLPRPHADILLLLMDVLMIEVRAESVFSHACRVMRDQDTFPGKRQEAETAAEMVEYIREDEQIHVGYLRTAISEMRGFTFKMTSGKEVLGSEFIDPEWKDMVAWHGSTQRIEARARTRVALQHALSDNSDLSADFGEFDRLESVT